MRGTLLFGCFAALFACVVGDCTSDKLQCKVNYDHSAPAGSDTATLCKVTNAYIRCLRNLQARQDCSTQNHDIEEERRKAEEKLNQQAPDCAHCTRESDACLANYNANATAAGFNDTAVCQDGQTYVLCLRNTSKKQECASESSYIETERRKAQLKLTQSGCDTGADCLREVDKCETARDQASQNTPTQQCKSSQQYHNCLKQQEGGSICKGLFLSEVKLAISIIAAQEKQANCSAIDTGDNGGASDLRPAGDQIAVVIATVLAAILALR